jgi:hypothetical protein
MPNLFSYGTLQQEEVQLSTFGRKLNGCIDVLPGYILAQLRIIDQVVLATSGKEFHPIAKYTGEGADQVPGMVFEVTDVELIEADGYEVEAYRRVLVLLVSGLQAWVYVEASDPQ